MRPLFGSGLRTVVSLLSYPHYECFTLEKLGSHWALFNDDGSLVAAPCGSGSVATEAVQQLRLWRSHVELVEGSEMGISCS